MSDVNDLVARIEGAFSAVKDKAKQQQQQELQHYQERQKLFQEYEKAQARVVQIARPRLEALAKRAGERVSVTPSVSESRRSAKFEFKSPKAHITLAFAVAPDRDLKNVVVESDLKIVPVLWQLRLPRRVHFTDRGDRRGRADPVARRPDRRVRGTLRADPPGRDLREGRVRGGPRRQGEVPEVRGRRQPRTGRADFYFIDETTKREFAKQKGSA